jgi:hypothetical protein
MHIQTKNYVPILRERDDGTPVTLSLDGTIGMTDSLYCI